MSPRVAVAVHLSDSDADADPEVPSDLDQELDERYQALVGDPTDLGMTWSPAADGLPSRVSVGGREFEVRTFDPGLSQFWDGLLGRISDAIYLRRDTPDHWSETLLHEILHAVDEAAGTQAGETVVNAWAPILLDVLRQHPEVLAFLTGQSNGPAG